MWEREREKPYQTAKIMQTTNFSSSASLSLSPCLVLTCLLYRSHRSRSLLQCVFDRQSSFHLLLLFFLLNEQHLLPNRVGTNSSNSNNNETKSSKIEKCLTHFDWLSKDGQIWENLFNSHVFDFMFYLWSLLWSKTCRLSIGCGLWSTYQNKFVSIFDGLDRLISIWFPL